MTDPLSAQGAIDERTTMYAALAFGGFMDAEETERVTVWAAARIRTLETSLLLIAERLERDRREPDKVLCYVQDLRRMAGPAASDERHSDAD